MTKECGFLEQLIISLIMLPNIVGRALCLGVIFAVVKIYGLFVLTIVFACQLVISAIENFATKSKLTSKMFLGILTSFTSPCLVVKELSRHFLVNGIAGCSLYIASVWIIYFNASEFRKSFPNSPLTLKCNQIHGQNFTTDIVTRCPFNATNSTLSCKQGLFYTNDPGYFTLCPEDYKEWHFLGITCITVTVLLSISFMSIVLLHYLTNAEKRMKLFKKFKIDTCPERDASIKSLIFDILNGYSLLKINKKANDINGRDVLELMIQSRRIHITKVTFQMCQLEIIFNFVPSLDSTG